MPPSDSPSPFFDPLPGWRSRHVVAGRFRFVGPADGAREQDLKIALLPMIRNNHRLSAAYLALIQDGNSKEPYLALCLKAIYPDDADQVTLNERLFDLFASMYQKAEHLDIISLDTKQEALLLTICPPFFERKDRLDPPEKPGKPPL